MVYVIPQAPLANAKFALIEGHLGRQHVELLRPERGSLVGAGAILDRGRHARQVAEWRDLFEEHFDVLSLEPHLFRGGLWRLLYLQCKHKQCVQAVP
jgi:hypothetical protein